MLTEPTLDRLRALRLGAMADAYRTQLQDPAIGALSFDERVGLLVDAEHLSRDNRKLGRRLKEAKLRMAQACLEDLEYAPRRELDRSVIRQLATGGWIAEHRNVLITGATGVGKTYLACALGQQACRQGGPPNRARRRARADDVRGAARGVGELKWLRDMQRLVHANVRGPAYYEPPDTEGDHHAD